MSGASASRALAKSRADSATSATICRLSGALGGGAGEPLHPRELRRIRFARQRLEIGGGEVRMRFRRPDRFDQLQRLLLVAMADEHPRRGDGGGREARPALQRLACEMQRVMRMVALLLHRHGGFDHGAEVLRRRRVDRLGGQTGLDRFARLLPVALRGEMFEHRGARPGHWRDVMRLLGEMMRGVRVLASARLDMQPAEPEQLRLRLQRHLVEGLFRNPSIAGELRRLGLQHLCERLARQQPFGDMRGLAGAGGVAGADGDEALRKRIESLIPALRPRPAAPAARQPQQRHGDRPEDDRRGDDQQQTRNRHRYRRFELVAGEIQRQRTRAVRSAIRGHRRPRQAR